MKPDSELTPYQYDFRRGRTKYQKQKTLRAKRTLQFIAQYPEGATKYDFEKEEVPIDGIEMLISNRLIIATQGREPERGTRCYNWVWKIMKGK